MSAYSTQFLHAYLCRCITSEFYHYHKRTLQHFSSIRNVRTKRAEKINESMINIIPCAINIVTIYIVYNFSVANVGTTHMRYLIYFAAINFARLCVII
jgi:hypothetical protein